MFERENADVQKRKGVQVCAYVCVCVERERVSTGKFFSEKERKEDRERYREYSEKKEPIELLSTESAFIY